MGGDGKGKDSKGQGGFNAMKGKGDIDPRMLGLMNLAGKGAASAAGGGSKGYGWGFDKGFFKGAFKGKGYGKGWWKGGKGQPDGLMVDPKLKVWIGNVPAETKWKDLQEHMDKAGKSKWVEVFSGRGVGTAAVAYGSEEDAANAIKTLNGVEFNGQALVVDTWVKKAPEPESDAKPEAEAS
eukprot:TRINITY_DN603_c0_g1_i1.p1 TRINITY_DN603_c0_g1~~TRINITY_DN603_c0_g1_i1.p1  ORF type:complete len:181 (-),score=67.05 TRINITY_DN603_c0_g1_i1:196-738(-)